MLLQQYHLLAPGEVASPYYVRKDPSPPISKQLSQTSHATQFLSTNTLGLKYLKIQEHEILKTEHENISDKQPRLKLSILNN